MSSYRNEDVLMASGTFDVMNDLININDEGKNDGDLFFECANRDVTEEFC